MFGKCRICAEKDLRISDLRKEIEFLKRMAMPSPALPTLNIEENYVMNGAASERPIYPEDPAEIEKAEEIQREADRIFSGNFENY